jgi:SOS response regulatory protein OraA/RecX
MANSGGGLARVTYLPGVVPPPEALVHTDEGLEDVDEFASVGAVQYSDCDSVEAELHAERSDDADAARASNISMYALARRGMSSHEMTQLLSSRDLSPSTVATEVERLERVQLLDDFALAETLVRTLHERKGLGKQALQAELRRRGINQSAIDEAIAALNGDDELSRATELAVKRAPQVRSLDNETARRRLSAFLMRKGYQGSIVSAAVKAALEPSGSGPVFR